MFFSDIIVMNVSSIIEVAKSRVCCPSITTDTPFQNIAVTSIICGAIVLISVVVAYVFLYLEKMQNEMKLQELWLNEKREVENYKRRQSADCMEKFFVFLEKQISAFQAYEKEYGRLCNEYKEHLESLTANRDGSTGMESDEKRIKFLEEQIAVFIQKEAKYAEVCKRYEEALNEIIKRK